MRNVLPAPVVFSRLRRPPLASTAHLAIARPSPDPPMSVDCVFPALCTGRRYVTGPREQFLARCR